MADNGFYGRPSAELLSFCSFLICRIPFERSVVHCRYDGFPNLFGSFPAPVIDDFFWRVKIIGFDLVQ